MKILLLWTCAALVASSASGQENDFQPDFHKTLEDIYPRHAQAPIDVGHFLKVCLQVRDANNFFSPEEQLHHPLLPSIPSTVPEHPDDLSWTQFAKHAKQCTDYRCMAQDLDRDPRQLSKAQCRQNSECLPEVSGMYCRIFPGKSGLSFCDCPRGSAYNATSCRCQSAELCRSSQDNCHNGLKCGDPKCSCQDLSRQLFEPHGGFCVEPGTDNFVGTFEDRWTQDSAEESQQNIAAIVIVSLLAFIVISILLGLSIYLGHQHANGLLCQRGDYRCEADEADQGKKKVIAVGKLALPVPARPGGIGKRPKRQLSSSDQTHVAAWDLPSLDYLDEEQTVKYIHRSPPDSKKSALGGADSLGTGATTASTAEAADITSSSVSSSRGSIHGAGSLPESEQSTFENRPAKPRSRSHSRQNSVDLRFNPVFQAQVDLEPGGGRAYDSITTSSDIL